jgi:hypothetical protein
VFAFFTEEVKMRPKLLGSEQSVSTWGIVAAVMAIGVTLAFLPSPVGADAAHTLVHIADPTDGTVQATVISESPETARLLVDSRTSEAQSGVVVTETLTAADPVGVFIEGAPEEITRNLSSVFAVAAPGAPRFSYLRFVHIKTNTEGGPACDSPAGTAFPDVQEFATMWVPQRGQAQIEFPMWGAHSSAGCAAEPCESQRECFVAYLISGGPVKASVTGPFD